MDNEKQISTEKSVQTSSTMFNRVLTFFSHLKEGVGKIITSKYKFSNDDFISMGRSEEEKELIRECVEEIDKQYEFIEEIEQEGRGVDLGEWYKKKETEIMKDLSDEEKTILSEIINENESEEETTIIESTNEILDCYDPNTVDISDLSQDSNCDSQNVSSNTKSE